MNIGILGAGNVGGTLGKRLLEKGHQIRFGVRKPVNANEVDPASAANSSDVVICALPWSATRGVLQSLDLQGKILLDCTNPLLPDLSGLEAGTTTSGGEMVAQWARGARVVKIFNTTGFNNMENPTFDGKPIPMFYCGDDAEAKQSAAALARDIGFDPIDAGPLANSRLLEPYALLWIYLAFHGQGRDFAFTLAKR